MVKIFITAVALFVAVQAVAAFNPQECTGYSFSARDVANMKNNQVGHYTTWYCGLPPPDDKFCAETTGGAWAVDTNWCNHMVHAVRNGKHNLAPTLKLNQIPTLNGGPIEMWSCYITNPTTGVTQGYNVDYRPMMSNPSAALPVASNINTQCNRNGSTFNKAWVATYQQYWKDSQGNNLPFNASFSTQAPTASRNSWSTCYFNNLNYPGLEYNECKAGHVCEYKNQWWSSCLLDPKADHQCCLSPNGNHCEPGQCCKGFQCWADDNGHRTCIPETPSTSAANIYTGICSSTDSPLALAAKTEKGLYSRCFQPSPAATPAKGDCMAGYNCIGSSDFADCQLDPKVVTECNWGRWENDCRPGDCAPGLFCKQFFKSSGELSWSQCRTGVEPFMRNGLPVHDGLCTTPNPLRTYNERLHSCTGAVCAIWGDPHIISCDGKRWDCQAQGLFVLMRNFMYEIQAHFSQMMTPLKTSASITDSVGVKFNANPATPKIQISYPKFVTAGETYDPKSKKMQNNCPIYFYVNDVMIDISGKTGGSVLHSGNGVVATLGGSSDRVILTYSPPGTTNATVVEIKSGGEGPFTKWGCIMEVQVCLPSQFESQFKQYSGGLMGTPDGNPKNEWLTRQNTTQVYGGGSDGFNFCVDNWCVKPAENIMTAGGKPFAEWSCPPQTYFECGMAELMKLNWTEAAIRQKCCPAAEPNCAPSEACKLDICATGTPFVPPVIEVLVNPTPNTTVVLTDDCSDLGKFISGQTGSTVPTSSYYKPDQCFDDEGYPRATGQDESMSVFVGKSYKCIKGTGVEGSMFVNYNFIVDSIGNLGCSSFAFTSRGACVHPKNDAKCIQVGGDVKIGASESQPVEIMTVSGDDWRCDLFYKGSCTSGPDSIACPTTAEELTNNYIYTDGQVTKNTALNITALQKEITILSQKQAFWKTYAPMIGGVQDLGVASSVSIDGTMTLNASPGRSAIQVFNFPTGFPSGVKYLKFHADLDGKTVLINVGGTNNVINVPYMMDGNDAPGASANDFSPILTTSLVWNFYDGSVILTGDNSFQGSVVVKGDLNLQIPAQLGRTLVLGNLVQDYPGSIIMNYPFKPSTPLPLPSSICTIPPPPECIESRYKVGKADEMCPNAPAGHKTVSLLRSQGTLPAGVDVLYNIQMFSTPLDGGAPTVKFSVDNPFQSTHADVYVKYEKTAGKFALDPECKRTNHVADCEPDAVEIEAGCVSHDGIDPYSIVTIYFASEDNLIYQQGLLADIDKCCHPEDYAKQLHVGVLSFTYEIKCACPTLSYVGA
jgi:choice-of-anchor A domain-containing protein